MKKYYHATPFKNLYSILEEGLKVGYDGITYLAETPQDALKFICLRCFDDILVIEVELDETKVQETFDHSYAFFKCRAYGYNELITVTQMTDFVKYGKNN